MASAATRIRSLWNRLSPLPGGKRLFGMLLGRLIPYTGSIRPQVEELSPGFARVSIDDRRRVRNHLDSVHAIALANLAEVTSGLAMHYDLPDGVRAILTGLDIQYTRKARGRLTAEAHADLPPITEDIDFNVSSVVRDESGEQVAAAEARWRVGPREPRSA